MQRSISDELINFVRKLDLDKVLDLLRIATHLGCNNEVDSFFHKFLALEDSKKAFYAILSKFLKDEKSEGLEDLFLKIFSNFLIIL